MSPTATAGSGEGLASWLHLPSSTVAHRLLGHGLVVGDRRGLIVEVEAYQGADDPASHASGQVTDRNRIMWGPVGRLYVYRSYGIHWCANVVCHEPDQPGAILIRAVEPVAGIDRMWADRPKARRLVDLGSGPGKLTAALGIDGSHNGADVTAAGGPVRVVPSITGQELAGRILAGPRIGISVATRRRWRFALADNANVSRPRRDLEPWMLEPRRVEGG